MRRLCLVLLLALSNSGAIARDGDPDFGISADLKAKILSHGPWPMRVPPDPSNRVAGSEAAVALGRMLFFDEGLSRVGALSCASCHKPERAWTDGRARASAAASLDRNTPTLLDVGFHRWFGWDGSADSLWMQSLRPLLDPREMAASPDHVRSHVEQTSALRRAYVQVFRVAPAREPAERVTVNVAKALAAFQSTLISGRTPFDDFRDAVAQNDAKAMSRYPERARRGLAIFMDKGNCSGCHAGPRFTDGSFHDTGIGAMTGGRIDTGRYGGLLNLRISAYNLNGAYNDDKQRRTAWQTSDVIASRVNLGQFRVPSLRNVARTAPYAHNGSKATLKDAVRHYAMLRPDLLPPGGQARVKRVAMSDAEIGDVVAFLESLSEPPAGKQ